MIRLPRNLLLITMLLSASASGVGAPVHGHPAHDGHDAPHIETDHHSHAVGFVQGDDRVQERGPRIPAAPPKDEPATERPAVTAAADAFDGEKPAGRDPPLPSAPRAPPA